MGNPIDATMNRLCAIAGARGWHAVEIVVGVDGRVVFRGIDRNGYTKGTWRADLEGTLSGAHPMPGRVVETIEGHNADAEEVT